MRKTLEDLYYGNISPNEQKMAPDSELKKAVDRVTSYESGTQPYHCRLRGRKTRI